MAETQGGAAGGEKKLTNAAQEAQNAQAGPAMVDAKALVEALGIGQAASSGAVSGPKNLDQAPNGGIFLVNAGTDEEMYVNSHGDHVNEDGSAYEEEAEKPKGRKRA
jgi:hypothetical protein